MTTLVDQYLGEMSVRWPKRLQVTTALTPAFVSSLREALKNAGYNLELDTRQALSLCDAKLRPSHPEEGRMVGVLAVMGPRRFNRLNTWSLKAAAGKRVRKHKKAELSIKRPALDQALDQTEAMLSLDLSEELRKHLLDHAEFLRDQIKDKEETVNRAALQFVADLFTIAVYGVRKEGRAAYQNLLRRILKGYDAKFEGQPLQRQIVWDVTKSSGVMLWTPKLSGLKVGVPIKAWRWLITHPE